MEETERNIEASETFQFHEKARRPRSNYLFNQEDPSLRLALQIRRSRRVENIYVAVSGRLRSRVKIQSDDVGNTSRDPLELTVYEVGKGSCKFSEFHQKFNGFLLLKLIPPHVAASVATAATS
ncbi:hypothetical protein ACS0PU_009369 [Formica fusca]